MSIECPYCEAELDDPDDCHKTDETYQHQCSNCDKYFVFTLDYTVNYYIDKADCLNGEQHDWQRINGWPKMLFAGKRRCSMCDEQRDGFLDDQDIKDLTEVDERDLEFAAKRLRYLRNKLSIKESDDQAS